MVGVAAVRVSRDGGGKGGLGTLQGLHTWVCERSSCLVCPGGGWNGCGDAEKGAKDQQGGRCWCCRCQCAVTCRIATGSHHNTGRGAVQQGGHARGWCNGEEMEALW